MSRFLSLEPSRLVRGLGKAGNRRPLSTNSLVLVSDDEPNEESESQSGYVGLWVAGVAWLALAVLGPLIAQLGDFLDDFAADFPRFLWAAIGFGLIAGTEGREAQRTWREDESWSPRVLAHGLIVLVAAGAFVVVAGLALQEVVEGLTR